MGFYANSSRDASSMERKKLWNPSEILGIINTDPGYQCMTCIGYAPTQRRRCRNPIRVDNREFITKTLNEMAYLHPDSSAVASHLRTIASPALCVRYHQNQAGTVIQQWQEKIKQIKPQVEERLHTKPVQGAKKKYAKPDQALEDVQEQLREMKRLVTELQEELKGQRQQDQENMRREQHEGEGRQEEDRKRQERARQMRDKMGREARRKEQERQEEERQEAEQQKKEQQEQERQEQERREKEQRKKEQQEKERQEKEQQAREQKAREHEAHNERIRQKAQKVREERERKDCERELKEREEWEQAWSRYQDRWVSFKASASREGHLRDAIPWPVKSASYSDVKASAVKDFMQMGPPRDADTAKLMRNECRKWHPDLVSRWLREVELTDVERMMVDMICRVVTDLLNNAAARSSEFLG